MIWNGAQYLELLRTIPLKVIIQIRHCATNFSKTKQNSQYNYHHLIIFNFNLK
jgi:hypothetical protein